MNKKQITTMFITLAAILIIGIISSSIAKANTIEKYENQVKKNDIKIQQIEEIKKQLHIMAEMVRNENSINNGFDLLLSQKWHEYNNEKERLTTENIELNNKIIKGKDKRKFVGYFTITHYNPGTCCNGSWGNLTASGTTVTPYRTIAVDPKVIPLGAEVEIQGNTYIAEDTGGAIKGNKIDLCVKTHAEAKQKGVLRNVPVYIISE